MAQAPVFKAVGGMKIAKGQTYTDADFATGVIITKAKVSEAPPILRKMFNDDGSAQQENGKDFYKQLSQRGVWILIKRTGVTYKPEFPNSPVLYKEGDEIAIHADNSYMFLSECFIEYGET